MQTLLRLLQNREGAQGLNTSIGRQVDRLLQEQHDDITATLRMLEEAQAAGRREERRLVLTHGDPNLANIIKDAHGQLHLIDWGAIALGPPERDLVFFTGPRFEMFLRAYVRGSGQPTLRDDLFGFYFYHWIATMARAFWPAVRMMTNRGTTGKSSSSTCPSAMVRSLEARKPFERRYNESHLRINV